MDSKLIKEKKLSKNIQLFSFIEVNQNDEMMVSI